MTDSKAGLPQESADEALLEQLAEALRPPALLPSPTSLAALQRAVEEQWGPTAGRARMMGRLASWARRFQRSGAAVVVLGGHRADQL